MGIHEWMRKITSTAYKTSNEIPDELGGCAGEYYYDSDTLVKDITSLARVAVIQYHEELCKHIGYGREKAKTDAILKAFLNTFALYDYSEESIKPRGVTGNVVIDYIRELQRAESEPIRQYTFDTSLIQEAACEFDRQALAIAYERWMDSTT